MMYGPSTLGNNVTEGVGGESKGEEGEGGRMRGGRREIRQAGYIQKAKYTIKKCTLKAQQSYLTPQG